MPASSAGGMLWAERKVDQGVVRYDVVMTRGRGWAVAAAADWIKRCRSDGDAAAEWRPGILFQEKSGIGRKC